MEKEAAQNILDSVKGLLIWFEKIDTSNVDHEWNERIKHALYAFTLQANISDIFIRNTAPELLDEYVKFSQRVGNEVAKNLLE